MPEFFSLPFFAPAIAFLLVVLLSLPISKIARFIGLIDSPGGRKTHEKAVPPIGGLIIFPLFMFVAGMAGADLKIYWPFYISLIILLTTGALDDKFSLNAWIKFAAHISAAALIVFAGNCQVAYLGDLFGFGTVWAGFMSYPFSIVAVVLLINAVNLMDGLDGLAGGMTLVMFLWLLLAAAIGHQFETVMMLGILMGALCGFMIYNMRNPWRRKASMFLGDSGSMCLGLSIAWFSIHLARQEHMPLEPISVAWIIGLPIFDACAQFYRRARNGRHPFAPDRGHFHYHFIAAGVPVKWTAPIIMVIVAVMGMIGYGGIAIGLPPVILTILWIAALFAHMAVSYKPERYINLIKKFIKDKELQ